MDNKLFIKSRKNYLNKVKDNSVTVLFSHVAPQKTEDQKYYFSVNRNFYYLAGIPFEKMILVLFKSGETIIERLFIEKGNPTLALWEGERLSKEEASNLSGIDIRNIYYDNEFDEFMFNLFNMSRSSFTIPDYIYLNLEQRNWPSYTNKALEYAQYVKQTWPHITIENAYYIIGRLRMNKLPEEINNLQIAIDITKEGIYSVMRHAKAGLYEYQLESYFDQAIKFHGAQHIAFKTIMASGQNGTVLHYEHNNSVIEEDTLVLMDLGAEYNLYSADITRTIPVSGKFTDRQKQIYEIVLKANKETINFIKPGISRAELNKFTRDLLIEECKKIGLIKEDNEINKYYYHSVSHLLGLDTHDLGDYTVPVEVGNVLTVEPGLYVAEEGIGIRIEDDVVVTDNGCINLSEAIIKEVKDIEEYMANNK